MFLHYVPLLNNNKSKQDNNIITTYRMRIEENFKMFKIFLFIIFFFFVCV